MTTPKTATPTNGQARGSTAAASQSAGDAPPSPSGGGGARRPAADTPPKGQAKSQASKGTGKVGRPSKTDQRKARTERLAGQLAQLSVGLMILSPADGVAVGRHSQAISEALAELAEQNPTVARILDGAAVGGAWLGLLAAVAPLVIELMANHGLLPEVFASSGEGDGPGVDLGSVLMDMTVPSA